MKGPGCAGVDLDGLVLLLGRFVHVGAAVDLLLKDADAAAEFAAVDVLPLLMAEMPEGVSRGQVEELLPKLQPDYVSTDGVTGRNRGPILEALPRLAADGPAARALVMAVNCRAGLDRLVGRFTPVDGSEPPAPEPSNDHPEVRLSRSLMTLAQSGAPSWGGDPTEATTEFDMPRRPVTFRRTHADAAALALSAVAAQSPGGRGAGAGRALMTYATHPFVSGPPGRWRIVRCDMPEDAAAARAPATGKAFRTATSAALVLAVGAGTRRVLWEYAPDGTFPADGPLAAAGARLVRADVLAPVRPGDWFTRFAELYRERGSSPPRPELAQALAERLGLSVAEATVLLMAYVPAAPHQAAESGNYRPGHFSYDLEQWKIREKEARTAVAGLVSALGPEAIATLYDKLLPDDPERLWTTGPDVDRAAEWWLAELGSPLPVPTGLLPPLAKELHPPTGEPATARRSDAGQGCWWPAPRPAALTGRVAAGADCLAPAASRLAGEPQPLALPRIAAWLAYRTPAGDPLRPRIGAAMARLREEIASATGPLTLFSLQSHHLMGNPPPTEALTAHPAVTAEADETYAMDRLRLDPAALKGPDDPLLRSLDDYLDSLFPSQWLPSPSGLPALADLRLLLSEDFGALGEHLAADATRVPGWEQHPARAVPRLVEECAGAHGLGPDAAALYLMLLALPDPTDRNVRTWTGWKPARFRAAVAELGASPLVVRGTRPRAGRSLFLPGAWQERKPPRLPIEAVKLGLLPLAREHRSTAHMAAVPSAPLPTLFARAWQGRQRTERPGDEPAAAGPS